jgi:hypothetical protein
MGFIKWILNEIVWLLILCGLQVQFHLHEVCEYHVTLGLALSTTDHAAMPPRL